MFKLLMSWNIRPGQEEDYFEFVVRELGPGLIKLGVRPTDAWYTQYGDKPQILQGGIVEELESLQHALAYVTDYRQKIIHASGGFQL